MTSPDREVGSGWLVAVGLAAAALVVGVWWNHFGNAFEFDDAHSIVGNPWIRSLANAPRFFFDATTFSTLPANQSWRPLLSVTYAVDYWLGGGLKPFWFHVDSFAWFVGLLVLLFVLLRGLLRDVAAGAVDILALFGAVLFGVHTANAETVNYISARSDLLSTFFLVLAFWLFVARPESRRRGTYLASFVLAALVKPVVLVFPVLVAAWVWIFESRPGSGRGRATGAAAMPALATTLCLVAVHAAMTPAHFTPGGSRWGYALTQPFVVLRYFKTFFLPTGLVVDSELRELPSVTDPRALAGFAFLAAMLAAIVWLLRRPQGRLVAFGLVWFLVTLAPTSSFFPLAEVENGHRTFLPYIGLLMSCLGALAVGWSKARERLGGRRWAMPALAASAVLVLAANAGGTVERNRVWRDPESLWHDCVEKDPGNGRAWTNFGLAQMERNRIDEALTSFSRALSLIPAWPYVHINMGIALAAKGRDVEAENEFRTSVALARTTAEPCFFYGRFLARRRRFGEAREQALQALALSPSHLDAHHLLLQVDGALGDVDAMRRDAEQVLRIWPEDEVARRALAGNETGPNPPTAEGYVAQSLEHFQAGRNEACVAACRKALALRPDYAEAWNNMCAAFNNLHRWDDAIAACRHAVRLAPAFELARNNLRWAESQKANASAGR